MGYFDALASTSLKKTSDGRWLFFPHGVLGRGYILDSEQAYETLNRRIKAFVATGLVLIIGALALQSYTATFVIGAICLVLYEIWTRFVLRGLKPSDEPLSLEESMTSQAIRLSAVVLWLFEIGALVAFGFGILFLVVGSADSRNWLVMLGSTIFFGICAVIFARMLILRRRSRTGSAQ